MTAFDPATLRIAAGVRALVEAERRADALHAAAIERQRLADAALLRACKAVGAAYDELVQAQFAGVSEIPARRALERAVKHQTAVMRRMGRMPKAVEGASGACGEAGRDSAPLGPSGHSPRFAGGERPS